MSEIIDELICPGCQGKEFLEGPHGCLAVNIECKRCGYRLNVAALPNGKFWIVDKLGKVAG